MRTTLLPSLITHSSFCGNLSVFIPSLRRPVGHVTEQLSGQADVLGVEVVVDAVAAAKEDLEAGKERL